MSSYFQRLSQKNIKQEEPSGQQEKYNLETSGSNYFTNLSRKPKTEEQDILIGIAEPEETKSEMVSRQIARSGLRAAEQIGGIGKNISQLPKLGLNYVYEKFTGKQPEGKSKEYLDSLNKLFGGISQYLPGPEEIRKLHEPLTEKISKPRSPQEEISDEIVGDVTNMFIPIPGQGKMTAIRTAKNIITPIIGQIGKQVAKEHGFDEGTQDKIKLGSMVLSHSFNPKGVENHVQNLYHRMERSIPNDIVGDARVLERQMKSLRNKMNMGTLAESERAISNEADSILEKIHNGEMSYQEAVASRRSINEKSARYLFDPTSKASSPRARKLYSSINNHLDRFIQQSEVSHPEFYKLYRSANEGFSAIAQSKRISNFIGKNIGKAATVSPVLIGALKGNIPGAIAGAGIAGASLATLRSAELLYRIGKSPTLRNYYMNSLYNASIGNTANFLNNVNKLQKNIEKDEETNQLIK